MAGECKHYLMHEHRMVRVPHINFVIDYGEKNRVRLEEISKVTPKEGEVVVTQVQTTQQPPTAVAKKTTKKLVMQKKVQKKTALKRKTKTKNTSKKLVRKVRPKKVKQK